MSDGLLDINWHDKPDLDAARQERERLAKQRPVLELRARAVNSVRRFFENEGFLEVTTPTRIATPALEDYIEAVPSGNAWLRTSPEFHIKRMIAAGYEKVFQIGPSFRREESGTHHLTEFMMLEWYRTGENWLKVMEDAQTLLKNAAQDCLGKTELKYGDCEIDLAKPWELITVEDAFRQFANADLDKCIDDGEFELVLCEKVEPQLGTRGRPTALTEYPLACSGLSRQIPNRPNRVERWEVYVAGIELGNACTELNDAIEQERRFRQCALLRQNEKRDVYPIDQPFLDAIRLGLPDCAGVAIGMDRLCMLLANASDISSVNAFTL